MSPTTTAILLLLALVVDYWSVGPNSLRDRAAFLMALPAFRVGFRNSPLTHWTTDALGRWIDGAKHAAHGSYISGADTNHLIGATVGILALFCFGVIMPVRWSSRLGPWARLSFGTTVAAGQFADGGGGIASRLNWRLWTCAFFLGVLADLPRGGVGDALRGFIGFITPIVATVPDFLFGN